MADPVRLIQGGRLPELDTLAAKTDAELNLLLRRFGLETDRAQRLEDAVVRATRQLQRAGRPSAAVIERATRQAESAVRRELMQLSKETLRAYEAQKRGDVAMLVWISVLDDSTCSDCETLHGEEHSPAEWAAIGEPGGDSTVCDGNCRCRLVDAAGYEPTPEGP